MYIFTVMETITLAAVSLSLSEGCSGHMMLHPSQASCFFPGFTLRSEATDRNIRAPPLNRWVSLEAACRRWNFTRQNLRLCNFLPST